MRYIYNFLKLYVLNEKRKQHLDLIKVTVLNRIDIIQIRTKIYSIPNPNISLSITKLIPSNNFSLSGKLGKLILLKHVLALI